MKIKQKENQLLTKNHRKFLKRIDDLKNSKRSQNNRLSKTILKYERVQRLNLVYKSPVAIWFFKLFEKEERIVLRSSIGMIHEKLTLIKKELADNQRTYIQVMMDLRQNTKILSKIESNFDQVQIERNDAQTALSNLIDRISTMDLEENKDRLLSDYYESEQALELSAKNQVTFDDSRIEEMIQKLQNYERKNKTDNNDDNEISNIISGLSEDIYDLDESL